MFPKQLICCAFPFALLNAGNNIDANIPIIATTTKSSIKVKPMQQKNLPGLEQPRTGRRNVESLTRM
jgi:hypothetical protein